MKVLWKKFTQALRHIRRRTIVLAIIGTLLFLLPTSLAIGWVIRQNAPEQSFSFSVEVFDKDRKPIATETASEDPTVGTNMADVLYRVITNGKQADRAPFESENSTPIYVSARYNEIASEYTCYFSVSGDGSYYMKDGHVFLISSKAASEFLSLPEAESLYRIAEPPVLYTNTELSVLPSQASWFYKLSNDKFQQAKNIQLADGAPIAYDFSGALSLHFSEDPDTCHVSVVEMTTGRLSYEGSYQGLSQFTVNPDIPLQIHVRATWKEREGAMCHGELSYNFIAMLRDYATFSLSKESLSPGDFLILHCQNIDNLDELSLQSDIPLTRYIFANDETVYCVIPYPTAVNSDTLSFTIKHGASKKTFVVDLLESPTPQTWYIENPSSHALAASLPDAQSELQGLLQTQFSPLSQTVYFRGNILSPEEYGFEKGMAFGDEITLIDLESPIISAGTEYLAEHGTTVPALNNGEVVSTGYCDALGNYVVLNHGLGIQTWYAHLSDLDVRIGDIVASGQTIGKAGVGGISHESGVLLLCTANGHLCDPRALSHS